MLATGYTITYGCQFTGPHLPFLSSTLSMFATDSSMVTPVLSDDTQTQPMGTAIYAYIGVVWGGQLIGSPMAVPRSIWVCYMLHA